MYFLAKNLRTYSRPFRGTSNTLPLYKNGVLNREYLAKNLSFFMMHPEQLKQKIKEQDAHRLCQFFDSDEYKQRVTSFLETQSKILTKDSFAGVKRVKYQHVLSCAQPSHKKPKPLADSYTKKEIKVNNFKSKKATKGTIIDHIMKKKSDMEAVRENDFQAMKKKDEMKKIRQRTTIMPIFLKKMKKKYVRLNKEPEDESKAPRFQLQTARRSVDDPEPLYAQILHRSNIYKKGLKTLAHRNADDMQHPRKFDTAFTPSCFPEKPHTLIFKGDSFNSLDDGENVEESVAEKYTARYIDETSPGIDRDILTKENVKSEPSSGDSYSCRPSNVSSKLDRVPYKLYKVNSKYRDISLKLGSPQNVRHVPLRMSSSTARIVQKGITTKLCPKKNVNMNRKSFSEFLCVEPQSIRVSRNKKTRKVPSDLQTPIKIEQLNKVEMKAVINNGKERSKGGGDKEITSLQLLMDKVYKTRTLDFEDNLERKNTILAILNRGVEANKRAYLEMPSLFEKVKSGSLKHQAVIKTKQKTKPENLETKITFKPIIVNAPKRELKVPKNEQQSCTYKIVAKNRERIDERLMEKFSLDPPFWKNTFSAHFGKPLDKIRKNAKEFDVDEVVSMKSQDFVNYEEQRQKLGVVSKNIPINLHRPVPHFVEHVYKPYIGRHNQFCAGEKLKILDSIQRRAVRLINDPALTRKLPSLAHRRAVSFYIYFHGLCSEELASVVPPLAAPLRTTRSASHRHSFTVQLENPEHPIFSAPLCQEYLLRLPKTTPEGYRVLMYGVRDPDPTKMNFNDVVKGFCMYNDCVLSEDGLQDGYIVIFDMKDVGLGHLARVSLPALKCFMYYIQDAHPCRLKEIHVLNTASWIHHVMRLIVPLVRSELLNLVRFHKGKTPDNFPVEILPMDYGGEASLVVDLDRTTKSLLNKYRDWLVESSNFKADESKRVKKAGWWGLFGSKSPQQNELDEKAILKNLQID